MQEQVIERMLIAASPEDCYVVLSAFERYSEWAADVKSVHIDSTDDQGRALVVTFRAAAFGRSTSYTLRYDYEAAPSALSWVQVDGDLTGQLDGSYHLAPSETGGTEIEYRLVVDLKVPLPGFVKRRAEGRIMGTALKDLKAFVEARESSSTPPAR